MNSLRIFVSLALATGLVCDVSAGESPKPLRVRVLSYNIHHGEGIDGKLDLERIARVVKAVKPDLVALQEVDRKVQRTRNVDQPAELARLTGMKVVFGGNIELQGGEYGNAVLSRAPILRHRNHLLPCFDKGEQRGVLAVELKIGGVELIFQATHLDHRADGRERLASARAINELATRAPDRPALLAGDLNDLPDSPPLTELGKHWQRSNERILPTVPVKDPRRQIDYILYRPNDRWRVIETMVLEEAVASDHRAILAVLDLVADKP
jgi:endonuclease/exonuclease/phosphatase family metal-dependent hydrolase